MFLSLLDLFLRLFYTLFSMNQNHGEYCILNEVHLSSIRLQRYKILRYFRQECQLNARYSHGYCLLTKREKFSWSLFFPLLDLTLLPVYIMTVIKVKLRVELYLFLLASKIFSSFRVAPAISVIRKIQITENTLSQHII